MPDSGRATNPETAVPLLNGRSIADLEESGGQVTIPMPEDAQAKIIAAGSNGEGSEWSSEDYQTKKAVAQGLIDIALLTANASQLSNLLETENHPNFEIAMGLLLASITLQILAGIMIQVVHVFRRTKRSRKRAWKISPEVAELLDSGCTMAIFLITVVNIFVAAFIGHGKAYIPVTNQQMFSHGALSEYKTPTSTSLSRL